MRNNRKIKSVVFRVDEETYDLLLEKAQKYANISEYIRRLIRDSALYEFPKYKELNPRKLRYDFRRVITWLEQIIIVQESLKWSESYDSKQKIQYIRTLEKQVLNKIRRMESIIRSSVI